MNDKPIIIVGAGQAGYQLAVSLRQEGYKGPVSLVGDEALVPYQRPPLSKAYMLEKAGFDDLAFRPERYFEEAQINRLHQAAIAIDRNARQVELKDGSRHDYAHLVVATGARNRPLPLPGAELDGVRGLRTLADADLLRRRLATVQQIVVVGAGFIGLEFAAVAAAQGKTVHIVELASRVMARAVSEPISSFFADAHREWGARLHLDAGISEIEGKGGRVSAVRLDDGTILPAELVVFGIGVVPNIEIAANAGLAIDNGIVVDEVMATADPHISAIGDCATFPCIQAGRSLRLESVQNAADQARLLASRLAGKPVNPYAALPWFWSDQGDLKLQMAGLSEGHDETVILGDPGQRAFSTLLYRQGRLIAVESVNRPTDFMIARKLLSGTVLPDRAMAAAPDFDLRAFAMAAR